ncbi:MAG TPA: cellulase family glycosylhydrolase, partial [Anaerolineae bacterium]|nr:cellulase family glycosylhydrolase [Anaerolineae bacterium]
MLFSRRAARWLLAGAALLVVLALAGAAAWRPLIMPALYNCTGEQDAREALKGLASYLYLQLTHPLPSLAPYTPLRHSGRNPFGVNTFLEQEVEPVKVARSLDLIRAAGFGFIRQEFPWEGLEISAKGDYWDHKWDVSAWQKYDRIVDMANERGLEVIARLDNPPAWARSQTAPTSIQGPPDRVEDFGDFVEAVVRRYRGRVRYYQVWNEPNLYHEWGDQPVDPVAYTRLLQEAYRRAKAVDPECVIISAGLAPTLEQGPQNLSDLTYLQRMYDAGAKGSFDILGVMAYGLWTGPTDRRVDAQRTNFARPQLMRALMVKNGDAGKPIWAMEIGWNAMPAGLQAVPEFGRVSREMQAELAVGAYERAQAEWPWMGAMS